jgi:hypothetical protein
MGSRARNPTDSGATWTKKLGDPPHDLNRIRWLANGRSIYVPSLQAAFRVSCDEGRKWQKLPMRPCRRGDIDGRPRLV